MIRHCLLMFAFLFPFMSFTTQAQEGGLFQEVEFHTELQMQRTPVWSMSSAAWCVKTNPSPTPMRISQTSFAPRCKQ